MFTGAPAGIERKDLGDAGSAVLYSLTVEPELVLERAGNLEDSCPWFAFWYIY